MARLPNVALAAIGLGDLVVEQLRPPAGAATDRWGVGVGEFAANLPKMPGLLRGLARRLNQFGSVVISPVGIGFDGDEVDWSRVTGVFTMRIPAEVWSKGLVRNTQMSPGLPAALVLADPAVRDFVTATARAHGIPVRPSDEDALAAAQARAAAIRSAVGKAVTLVGGLVGQAGTRSSA